ncbi:unnamed protein product, partial [Cylicocyclus nassatus]
MQVDSRNLEILTVFFDEHFMAMEERTGDYLFVHLYSVKFSHSFLCFNCFDIAILSADLISKIFPKQEFV